MSLPQASSDEIKSSTKAEDARKIQIYVIKRLKCVLRFEVMGLEFKIKPFAMNMDGGPGLWTHDRQFSRYSFDVVTATLRLSPVQRTGPSASHNGGHSEPGFKRVAL
ncbi:hypothetical protein CEXT_349571 [Caerostris extrusa]|uniref:Uncharacterized protein n=1 Tax=Caerostris extrusa TaxID=172846 RepID=A0AAV4VAC9_CAEEX|nr:hypothetical protein CEXT_349571 [Caerostris extrusa]